MPNYDLRCSECGVEFNIRASMSEKSDKRIPCPTCGSCELETIFKAAPAFVKGKNETSCPNAKRPGCMGCRHAG